MQKTIGLIGLGKMGKGLALNLLDHGWTVHGYNRTFETAKAMESDSLQAHEQIEQLVEQLATPRIIWLMVPAFAKATADKPADSPVDEMLAQLTPLLAKGDLIIDGGNSRYTDSIRRAKQLAAHGIHFLDAGVSGGPSGARNGACIMVGGQQEDFKATEELFADLALPDGYAFFPGHGAGHFVKMVHNGIEYGMMQAIAEGFTVLKESQFTLDLPEVARIYQHGSVIESRLVGWVESGLAAYGVDLDEISSTVGHTGEGAWTVEAAKELGVPTPVIEASLEFRKRSASNSSYTGNFLSMIRNQFGGHSIQ